MQICFGVGRFAAASTNLLLCYMWRYCSAVALITLYIWRQPGCAVKAGYHAHSKARLVCALQVTAMILLFPVARNVLAFLRAAPLLKRIIPFDSSITFHRFFGYTCMSAYTLALHQCDCQVGYHWFCFIHSLCCIHWLWAYALAWLSGLQYRTVLYCTVLYCTVPYCTVPYCTVHHSPVMSTRLWYHVVQAACFKGKGEGVTTPGNCAF